MMNMHGTAFQTKPWQFGASKLQQLATALGSEPTEKAMEYSPVFNLQHVQAPKVGLPVAVLLVSVNIATRGQ